MDPCVFDQVLAVVLPVALVLFGLNVGVNMIGFGKTFIQRLTKKVVSGLIAILIIYIVLVALRRSVPRRVSSLLFFPFTHRCATATDFRPFSVARSRVREGV